MITIIIIIIINSMAGSSGSTVAWRHAFWFQYYFSLKLTECGVKDMRYFKRKRPKSLTRWES